MKSVIARRGQPASLPIGWHRRFLFCFFGDPNSKGLYSSWPGPVPDLFVCLGFLGLTFIRLQSGDEGADWIKYFRVPGEDQSWTGPAVEDLTDDEASDPKLAVIKANVSRSASWNVEEEEQQQRQEKTKPSRHHSEGIQPDEVIEFELEPQDAKPKKTQTRRHSEHHPTHKRDEFSEHIHHKRQSRYSMNSMPVRNGFEPRSHPQYFMETTTTDGVPDSSAFNTPDTFDDTASEFTPLAENPRYRARKNRRRSSVNSSVSARSVQSDSFPRAPSPPHENPTNIPNTPSPRKLQRRTSNNTSPPSSSNRFRSLSPIADYHPRRVPSPSNTEPLYYRSESSYMPTPETSDASWSEYALPHPAPTPRSPGSTVSYASSYVPGSAEEVIENVNGDFTVKVVRSVSDTPEGRFYKVRWATTWESKTSMRGATESGKYTVREVLESKYVNGKGLYHVRWQDTWESEEKLGDIDPVRVFWQDVASGRRSQGQRSSFA